MISDKWCTKIKCLYLTIHAVVILDELAQEALITRRLLTPQLDKKLQDRKRSMRRLWFRECYFQVFCNCEN